MLRNAAVETRAAGASLAPGAQPGLPPMVVVAETNNGPIPGGKCQGSKAEWDGGSGHCVSKGNSVCQTGKYNQRFCGKCRAAD